MRLRQCEFPDNARGWKQAPGTQIKNMGDIYLLHEGSQDGPYTEDEIHQALAWGFIPDDVLARTEGLTDWIKVGWLVDYPEALKAWKVATI